MTSESAETARGGGIERDVAPQDPPEAGPDREPRADEWPQDSAGDVRRDDVVYAGDPDAPDDAPEAPPTGPMTRLRDDVQAGRIAPDEAVRRLLGALAADEQGSDAGDAVALYADEYDDDGNPHGEQD